MITLLNLIPVFCYILSVVFLGEHISANRILALLFCFSGAVAITINGMLEGDGHDIVGGKTDDNKLILTLRFIGGN